MKTRASWGTIVAACLGLTAVMLSFSLAQPPAQPAGRKVFTNSVIPLPPTGLAPQGLVVNAADLERKQEKMDVLFSLAIPPEAKAKLQEKVLKGEVVDPKELASTYAPKAEDLERLSKWLKDQGFQIIHTTPEKTGVYARGTVAQIEKSLDVKMVRVTKNGQTYTAARNAPSLPNDVAQGVQAVIGLQPFLRAAKNVRPFHPTSTIPAPTTSVANAPPYLIKEVLKAYEGDELGVTGKGQTIAILIDRLPVDDDTAQFWNKNNLPTDANRVVKINIKGVPLPLPDDGEESMDVQWSSGIARDAKVRVYACGTLEFVDLDRGLDRILSDAVSDPSLRQVSISLGLGEQFLSPDGTLGGEVSIENDKFLSLAAIGVNVFVSSGDGGSNPDELGQSGGATAQSEWMSSCPNVVAVGGTSLRLASTGEVNSEGGWPGSGGGLSKVFDRPPYQNRPGMPQGQKRAVPDVSALADPATGAYVRVNGVDRKIGGTSLSAPVWAGFCALINEARVKANKPRVPFLNPSLYGLMGSDCFRDINDGSSNGAFTTTPGYDMVTGIGVPRLKNLVTKLTQ
jgi:kumamolisin